MSTLGRAGRALKRPTSVDTALELALARRGIVAEADQEERKGLVRTQDKSTMLRGKGFKWRQVGPWKKICTAGKDDGLLGSGLSLRHRQMELPFFHGFSLIRRIL